MNDMNLTDILNHQADTTPAGWTSFDDVRRKAGRIRRRRQAVTGVAVAAAVAIIVPAGIAGANMRHRDADNAPAPLGQQSVPLEPCKKAWNFDDVSSFAGNGGNSPDSVKPQDWQPEDVTQHDREGGRAYGNPVYPVQQALNVLRPNLPCLEVNGIYDPATVAAVKDFQTAHGLKPVDMITPATYDALFASMRDFLKAQDTGVTFYELNPAKERIITTTAMASKELAGTDESFISFVKTTVTDLHRDSAGCGAPYPDAAGIAVSAYDPAGYAIGAVSSCGGARVIWSNKSGTWKDVMSTQEGWRCADLEKYTVPSDLIGPGATCWAPKKEGEPAAPGWTETMVPYGEH